MRYEGWMREGIGYKEERERFTENIKKVGKNFVGCSIEGYRIVFRQYLTY